MKDCHNYEIWIQKQNSKLNGSLASGGDYVIVLIPVYDEEHSL